MIKYNTNGEIVLNRAKLIDYYDNAAIPQLKGNDKRYVLVSGSGNFEIKLSDEDGTVYSTSTSYTTDSYKINILPIDEGRILVGWGYQKVNMVYLSQYKLVDNTFIEEKHTEWFSENKYITCIQMESNNAIICQYINKGCDENFMILKEDFTQIGNTSIYKSPVCAFDKILYMGNDYFVCTMMFSSTLYAKSYKHENHTTTTLYTDKELMTNCEINTKKLILQYFLVIN